MGRRGHECNRMFLLQFVLLVQFVWTYRRRLSNVWVAWRVSCPPVTYHMVPTPLQHGRYLLAVHLPHCHRVGMSAVLYCAVLLGVRASTWTWRKERETRDPTAVARQQWEDWLQDQEPKGHKLTPCGLYGTQEPLVGHPWYRTLILQKC